MITTWRIVKPDRASDAFSGKGARLFGGRWNSAGVSLVYTSSTASLAALEILVHLSGDDDLSGFLIFACSFSERLVDEITADELPDDWREDDVAHFGDTWIKSESSAVLRVPSVIIDSEFNYLLNPAHRDFPKIEVRDPVPFSLDVRLLRR